MSGELIIGIGVGIIITCIVLLPFYQRRTTMADVEVKAREMGMIYADEVKAILQNPEGGESE